MLRASKKTVASANGLRFGIAAARYNAELADALVQNCRSVLEAAGGKVQIVRVPGSFEVSGAAARLAKSGKFDCIIGLGILLQGETSHAQHIAAAVAHGLTQIAITCDVPTVFGIVTANNLQQARVRCLGKTYNRGREAAQTAIELARPWTIQ